MSTKPETRFINSVHMHLPAQIYRMKNHNMYNAGIPDCWYSGNKGDLWVEYKFTLLPVRSTTKIDWYGMLSTLQQDWVTRRRDEGRHVLIVVGCPSGGVVFDQRSSNAPLTASDFLAQLRDRKEIANHIASLVTV